MPEQQEDILASVLTGLIAALRALVIGAIILAAGTVAAVAVILAIVTTVVGAALSALAAILRTVREWLRELVAWLIRLLCLAFPIIVGIWAWPRLAVAFGGDPAAYIPATLIVAFPPLLATLLRRDAGSMFAAGVVTGLLTLIILVVPPLVRQIGLVILLAAILLRFIHTAHHTPVDPSTVPPTGDPNGTQEIFR